MAGRNRNTFLKRQKEIERMRKAREKMARRHGKRGRAAEEAVGEGAEDAGTDGGLSADADDDAPYATEAHGDAEELVQHAE